MKTQSTQCEEKLTTNQQPKKKIIKNPNKNHTKQNREPRIIIKTQMSEKQIYFMYCNRLQCAEDKKPVS